MKSLLEKDSLILIDGLDLLSPSDDFRCYDYISNFISEYSDCRYVISSRPGYYDPFKRGQFKIYEIEELTDEKMELFIQKYAGDDKSAEFIKNFIFNEKFKSLYRNPLMLFLGISVAKEIFDKKDVVKEDVFSSRSKLYEGFIRYLFYYHHREKGRILHSNEVQINDTLKDIYFKLQCKNKIFCNYQEALEIAKEHTKGYRKTTPDNILMDIFDLGLLSNNKADVQYGFHQSFQEYYAAFELADLFKKGMDISPAFQHPKWENVVIFASETFENPDEFIKLMIENGMLVLASKCAENASKRLKEELCALLVDGYDSRFKIEKTEAIKSIGRLGDTGISILSEGLHDENEAMNQSAAIAFGRLKSEKAVELLIKALHDKNDSVRRGAANALGEIKSEKAIEPLTEALCDKNNGMRRSAANALGKLKFETTVKSLIEALHDENDSVRWGAANALGKLKSEKAVGPLIEALCDKNDNVRRNAARALGRLKSKTAVESLIEALHDENDSKRRSAANALGEFKSEKAVGPLIEALCDKNDDVRRSAANALGEFKSEKAIEPLIKTLHDKNNHVRRNAANALGKLKSEKAIEPLIEALCDKKDDVRQRVANALGELKSKKAIEPLIEALCDKNDRVRWSAANALGRLKSEKAVEPLIEALCDKNNNVRRRAADALGKLKSEKAVEPLIKALHDEDDDMRQRVANALGEICTTVHVEMLKYLMNSDNAFEANTGFNILREINKREYSELELFQKIKKSFKKEEPVPPNKQGCSDARPAEEGRTDPYMKIYVDKLISITEPRTMIDYGCGNGKLLCAMKKIPSLNNLSYIGVDTKSACRFRARLTAEKYGFFKSMMNQPEFLKPEDFFDKELLADYVFMMHIMHELRLVDLVDVIYHNSAKLKIGGWIYILDQRFLVEKERDFVLWDTEKDLKTLFSGSGLEPYWLPMDTGKDHKLCSVAVQKVKENYFPKDKVAENCRAIYESKKERLLRKRKSKQVNDGSLDGEIANITEQLDEYDKKFQK